MVYGRKRIARRTRRPVIRRVRRTAVRKGTRRVMYRARRYRTPTEFPATQFVKLRASQDLTMALSGTSGTYNQYSLNNVYDPYLGVDTQSVSGYSAWASMYRKSMVYGVKAVFSGVCTSNDSPHLLVGMITTDAAANVPSSSSNYGEWLAESKGGIKHAIPPWITPQPYPRFFLKRYFSVARAQGLKTLDPEHYGAETNASPAVQPRLMLVLACTDGFTATTTVQCRIQLTYYVRFSAPRTGYNAE